MLSVMTRAAMPYARRKPFSNSVVIKSIDREKIQAAAQTYADHLRRHHPEIEKIIWFGSYIVGLPTPASDVDLCLIITSSDKPVRDRISEYLPLGFPAGIDLFVYTNEEFEQLKHSSPGWSETIRSGQEI